METGFTADFFIGNRAKLRALFTGTAPIVLTANGLLQRNADTSFPFRQDSSFWYLTGIDEPDIILVLDKDKEYLILSNQESHQITFDGAINVEELVRRSGIETVFDTKTGWKQVESRLKRAKHIATLGASATYVDSHGFFTNPARANLLEKIKDINSEIKLLDLRQHLATMRMVKQAPELQALRQAIDITGKTLNDVKRRLGFYKNEYEIEADITRGFRKRGASGHAFTPIVASGANACVIHYLKNNDDLQKARFVLLDVGAEVDQYAADITRMFWLVEPSKREKTIYEAVYEVKTFAEELLKPGILIREYESQVEQFMGEKLRSLGLIKTIEHESVRQFFPHAVSHHLGLDAHDSADYEHRLESGMVLTVEPGIYIPKEGIGVRIEDDVLITQNGVDLLSKVPSAMLQWQQ
ncbi:aminopeptidase P N-terminal domain-containing protein [Candidatus Saccharibacteria bacterium]|nr:aminopeptidase P N-terminal domain-containing protein [Candidatus Saccharibacteria bacterium]MBI3338360.1 aminopeptidase P N-terminal domain-containing protein [Candidatus Saccharibacteria bacterium]